MKSLNIIDVGARFGIHPSNLILKNIANHHLIEADENECLKLRKIYKNNSNVKIYKEFISNKKKIIILYILILVEVHH